MVSPNRGVQVVFPVELAEGLVVTLHRCQHLTERGVSALGRFLYQSDRGVERGTGAERFAAQVRAHRGGAGALGLGE